MGALSVLLFGCSPYNNIILNFFSGVWLQTGFFNMCEDLSHPQSDVTILSEEEIIVFS